MKFTRVNRWTVLLFSFFYCWAPRLTHQVAAEDTVIQLDSPIEEVAVAASGQYILLKLRGQQDLAVYDTTQKAICRKLRLPSTEFIFAAGGKTVLVFLKEDNLLQSWSLDTFQKTKTREFADPGPIMRLVMGHTNDDLAFIRVTSGSGALDNTLNLLLDARELTTVGSRRTAASGHNNSFRDFVHYRSDGGLKKITEWATSHSPSGVGLFVRTGEEFRTYYDHDSQGYLTVGDDGNVYAESGSIYSDNPRVSAPQGGNSLMNKGKIEGHKPFPGLGGAFVLGIKNDGTLSLFQAGRTTPFVALGTLPQEAFVRKLAEGNPTPQSEGLLAEAWTTSTFTLDKRVIFAPELNYIVFLPNSNDLIIQRDFNIKETLKASGKDYLLVASGPNVDAKAGETWTYQVKVVSKSERVKYQLEIGPEGMELSQQGLLSWRIPANIEGRAKVSLRVADESENDVYQRFTVEFK